MVVGYVWKDVTTRLLRNSKMKWRDTSSCGGICRIAMAMRRRWGKEEACSMCAGPE
jgi:hypothetical protein